MVHATTLVVHDVMDVRVVKASPDNHNATTLTITRRNGDMIGLELYRLPTALMHRILAALSDDETIVRVRDGVETAEDYLATEKVMSKMEGNP